MNPNHQPDPEFISNLEWQVRTALRREHRFAEPVQSRSGGRMKIATLVLVSALFGAGGVVVTDEVQDARRQEILLAEIAAEKRVAVVQLELLRSRAQEAQRLYDQGYAGEEALRAAQLQLRQAEIHVTKLQLNEEEIRATGREPNDELSAPLVEGRDLMSQRLSLEAVLVSDQRSMAQAQLDRMRELQRDDLVPRDQVTNAEISLQQVEVRLQELSRRLNLRQQVLEGVLTGEAAEDQLELEQIQTELTFLSQVREEVIVRVRRAEELVVEDLAPENHLVETRLELMEVETRMELLRLKLRILEEDAARQGAPGQD